MQRRRHEQRNAIERAWRNFAVTTTTIVIVIAVITSRRLPLRRRLGSRRIRPPDRDSESTYSWSTAGLDARPKNSVFSVFCPEAMKYQVDLQKALPIEGARCRCGYVWNASCCAEDRTAMVIKDGFQITPRFLGKSHCDKGLGCVLCTVSSFVHSKELVMGRKE